MKHKSNIFLNGYVHSIEKVPFKKNQKNGILNIGIKDENSIVYCQCFYSNNEVFFKGKRTEVSAVLRDLTPSDGDEKRIYAKGSCFENEYVNKDGIVQKTQRNTINSLSSPYKDIIKCTFNITGVVESIVEMEENVKIRIGMIDSQWDSDNKKNIPCIKYVVVFAENDMAEKVLEELDEGCECNVVGTIVNSFGQTDEYGRPLKGGMTKRGMFIDFIESVDETPDLDEYEKLKKKTKKEKVKAKKDEKKSVPECIEDDDDISDDDLEEVDF